MIDETSTLAKVLSSDSSISSMLDMSIRLLPGDHGLPLQQVRAFSKKISNMLKIFSLLLNRSSIKVVIFSLINILACIHKLFLRLQI